jgi:hypothetical protein
MPEPPFQNDPRSQDLPPQTQIAAAHLGGTSSFSAAALLLSVTRPEELPDALRQHEKSVVIENTPANASLRRDFDLLLRWQRWKDTNRLLWLAALVFIVLTQMVITSKYKLEASWHVKWMVIEVGGKITLTPD